MMILLINQQPHGEPQCAASVQPGYVLRNVPELRRRRPLIRDKGVPMGLMMIISIRRICSDRESPQGKVPEFIKSWGAQGILPLQHCMWRSTPRLAKGWLP